VGLISGITPITSP